MNYIRIFQDSIRLIKATKLIWVFGFISSLDNFILSRPLFGGDDSILAQIASENLFLICLFIPIGVGLSILSLIGEGSLIFCIY